MARITYVKKAQQRYRTVPVLDENGQQVVVPVFKKNGEPKLTKKGKPITRRLTREDKSQPKPNLKCGKCSKEIQVGEPYKWVATKSGPYGGSKKIRCAACPNWRPSELTGSSARQAVYGAQEAAQDALSLLTPECDASDFEQILQDLAEGVREGAQAYEEAAEAIESGFGHSTYVSDELNEKKDTLESAADEIEGIDIEEFDEEAAKSEALDEVTLFILVNNDDGSLVEEGEAYDTEDEAQARIKTIIEAGHSAPGDILVKQATADDIPDDHEAIEEFVTEKRQEWFDAQFSEVEGAIDNIEIP